MKLYGENPLHVSDWEYAVNTRPKLTSAFSRTYASAIRQALASWDERCFSDLAVNEHGVRKHVEAYDLCKELSIDLFTTVILGQKPSLASRNQIAMDVEKHSTIFWRAATSVASFTDGFVPSLFRSAKTSFETGVAAKEALYAIFDLTTPDDCVANDLNHLPKAERQEHLLLFTSSLAHKSFSSLLTSCLKVMEENPEVLEKLRQEIPSGSAIGDAHGYRYLNAFLNEVERLYPPVIGTYLAVGGDPVQIITHSLGANSKIWCSILSANRDERVWGENANEFRPERWLCQCTLPCSCRITPHLTFGFGQRGCIGRGLVRQMLLMTCAYWISQFEWEIKAKRPIRYRWFPVARPQEGLPLEVRRRQDKEEFCDATEN